MGDETVTGVLRRLKQTNEDLEKFAYGAAHDLKGPLRGINRLAGFVLEDVGDSLPDASRRHLEQIGERAEQLAALVDGLLQFATLHTDEIPREVIDLDGLSQRLWSLGDADTFTLVLAFQEPSIYAPQAAVQRVLHNLLGNAIKHHDRSSGVITVGSRARAGCVELIVSDDGPGIPERFRGRAMEPFTTLHTGPRKGSGMGLALVQRTMEQLGGSVRLEAVTPRGLSVIVEWPTR